MLVAARENKIVVDATGFVVSHPRQPRRRKWVQIFRKSIRNGDVTEEEYASIVMLQIWAWIEEKEFLSILCCRRRWRRNRKVIWLERSNRWTNGSEEMNEDSFVFSR